MNKNEFNLTGTLLDAPQFKTETSKAGKEYSYCLVKLETDINYSATYNETNTFEVKIFGKGSEKITNAKKGDLVAIVGSIKSREYNGKTYIDLNPRTAEIVEASKKEDEVIYSHNVPDEKSGDELPF
jgi:single-stranded DNA-binding protein